MRNIASLIGPGNATEDDMLNPSGLGGIDKVFALSDLALLSGRVVRDQESTIYSLKGGPEAGHVGQITSVWNSSLVR